MFVIVIDYRAPLTEIDAALDAHNTWLDRHYATDLFLASGPREPRTGGVILTADRPRTEIDEAIATDPFAVDGLAEHRVIEFRPSRGVLPR